MWARAWCVAVPAPAPAPAPAPRSPERQTDAKEANLPLPSTTYRKNRSSALYANADISSNNNNNNANADDNSFFIPVALDPSPAITATPKSTDNSAESKKQKEKDYFSISKPASASERKDSQSSTPHIAFQEKPRQPSSEYDSPPAKDLGRKLSKSSRTDRSNSSNASPIVSDDRSQKLANAKSRQSDDFKLQEAPKSKKVTSSRTPASPESASPRSNDRKDGQTGSLEPTQHLQTGDLAGTPRSSQDSRLKEDDDVRSNTSFGTSSGSHVKSLPRKEVGSASRTGSYKL